MAFADCNRKSTLRKPDSARLGPQYDGSSITRKHLAASDAKALNEQDSADQASSDLDADEQDDDDIDSLNALENGDRKQIRPSTFRGSGPLISIGKKEKSEADDASDQGYRDGSEDDKRITSAQKNGKAVEPESESDNSFGNEDGEVGVEDADSISEDTGDDDTPNSSLNPLPSSPGLDDRAALRKMMVESQKAVVDTISKATKADLAKGKAIKHQRTIFDALLNTRIRLQKALVATNSLSSPQASPDAPVEDLNHSMQAAESAALALWTQLDNLRQSLQTTGSKKRPFSATRATPTPAIWSHMQSHDTASLPTRRATLTKWSTRLQPPTPLSQRSSLSTPTAPTPLTTLLDQHLSTPNAARLLARTRTPRSCAPLQAAARSPPDATIYDDADFYTQLLRELVEQRMADSALPSAATVVVDDAGSALTGGPSRVKVRKIVDTKASKGRKMRYTVHEKLQNFMPPEDRGTWGEAQARELFAGLLGRRVVLEEEGGRDGDGDGDDGSGGEDAGVRREEAALMMFRR